jgi:hypothetical protein
MTVVFYEPAQTNCIKANDIFLFLTVIKTNMYIQGVSAKAFEPNISVIYQRIFMKFKMQIF